MDKEKEAIKILHDAMKDYGYCLPDWWVDRMNEAFQTAGMEPVEPKELIYW